MEATRATMALENLHKQVKGKQSSEALCMYRTLFNLVIFSPRWVTKMLLAR